MFVKYEALPAYRNENTVFLPYSHFSCVSKQKISQEIFSHPSVVIGFASSREMAQAASETGIVLCLMLLDATAEKRSAAGNWMENFRL